MAMSAAKRKLGPSLAMTLEGLNLVLGPPQPGPRSGRRITREDGSLWFEGTAWSVSMLLLAAPEMLEALKDADDDLHDKTCPWFPDNGAMDGRCNCGVKDTHLKVKAAIAKAEGREP